MVLVHLERFTRAGTLSPRKRSGIPRAHWYGREGDFDALVLERLDCTLENLNTQCAGSGLSFTYGAQMLSRLETLHSIDYIHCDVKPANFMIGAGSTSEQVFLIDFGLTRLFRDPSTRQHLAQVSGLKTIGTLRFASINNHHGRTQSRRDDLESLAYSILYLFTGHLPWEALSPRSGENYNSKILEMKEHIDIESLCQGLPPQFVSFVKHIRSLRFDSTPNYVYLFSLLTQCISACKASNTKPAPSEHPSKTRSKKTRIVQSDRVLRSSKTTVSVPRGVKSTIVTNPVL